MFRSICTAKRSWWTARRGASYYTSVKALSDLGAELVAIHTDPDGTNINANCGSTHMDELKARVVYEKADAGIAFDGDADRMLAVDEKGNLVDGDQVMAICGNYMKQKGRLKKNTIVVTIMSNLGFTLMGEKEGIHVEKTKVGDGMFWRTCGNTDTISEVSSPDTLFSWMTIRPETGF